MAKFIEVTDRGDKTKELINIENILSISEEPNGLAFIELKTFPDTEKSYGFPCMETYTEIYNYLAECLYI